VDLPAHASSLLAS